MFLVLFDLLASSQALTAYGGVPFGKMVLRCLRFLVVHSTTPNRILDLDIDNFFRQALALQASLKEIVERVEIVRSEHEKLEGGNKFLQS